MEYKIVEHTLTDGSKVYDIDILHNGVSSYTIAMDSRESAESIVAMFDEHCVGLVNHRA